jgi:hypothetical protein
MLFISHYTRLHMDTAAIKKYFDKRMGRSCYVFVRYMKGQFDPEGVLDNYISKNLEGN